MTPTRTTDHGSVTIDRKIPLWGVLVVVGGLVVQGALVWNGQNLQAAETRHQSEQIHDLAEQVKTMAAQIAAKDAIDVGQDANIRDLNRRMTAIEEARARR